MEDLQTLRTELYTRIDELLFESIGQHVSEIHKEDLDKLDYEQLVTTYDAVCELQELSEKKEELNVRTKAMLIVLDEIEKSIK